MPHYVHSRSARKDQAVVVILGFQVRGGFQGVFSWDEVVRENPIKQGLFLAETGGKLQLGPDSVKYKNGKNQGKSD
jgi:hypothetical protein